MTLAKKNGLLCHFKLNRLPNIGPTATSSLRSNIVKIGHKSLKKNI